MPCRVDLCDKCSKYECPGFSGGRCMYEGKTIPKDHTSEATECFDTAGALCDVLSMLEHKAPLMFSQIDNKTLGWWAKHEKREQEKIKKEALAKLTPKEKRSLGL